MALFIHPIPEKSCLFLSDGGHARDGNWKEQPRRHLLPCVPGFKDLEDSIKEEEVTAAVEKQGDVEEARAERLAEGTHAISLMAE